MHIFDLKKRPILLLPVGMIVLGIATGFGMTTNGKSNDPRDASTEIPITPKLVVGVDACAKCHAAEIGVWKMTPHHETFQTLHRKPAAQEIAKKLGISSFKHDSACIKCHYTLQDTPSGLDPIAGVSCESCHGPAKNWVDIHHNYGGPGVKRDQETDAHRQERLNSAIAGGMRNPVNVYLVAQSCYRCHTVPDENLVNVGGHVAGSMNFELVAWSQGKIRHNFVRSDGKVNEPSSPERLRLMFLSGMIADLEFSLRATAAATVKADFGKTSAQRAQRATKRLTAAQIKVNLPILDEILSIANGVKLKLNNKEELLGAADKINELGIRFAATTDGAKLDGIDKFLPPLDQWK
ncbi:MAG: cytochrome c family protein [Pirellulales bacterium]